MKYLVGSQNFGFDTPESDFDYMEFVFPTAEKICDSNFLSKERKEEDGSITKVKDVRLLPILLYKSNLDIIQILFAKEKETNEIYEHMLHSFLMDNREALCKMNIFRLYKAVYHTSKQRIKDGTPKDLCHAVFQLNFLCRFESNGFTDAKGAWEYVRDEYNWDHIRKTMTVKDAEHQLKIVEKIEDDFKKEENNEIFVELQQLIGRLVAQRIVNRETKRG